MQAGYISLLNATEAEYEATEAQFYQTIYSCDDVPYYTGSSGGLYFADIFGNHVLVMHSCLPCSSHSPGCLHDFCKVTPGACKLAAQP